MINDTGLSIGVEDGIYQIQADFEEQSGFYDEWGNFIGGGVSFVGSSSNSVDVPASIFINQAYVLPSATVARPDYSDVERFIQISIASTSGVTDIMNTYGLETLPVPASIYGYLNPNNVDIEIEDPATRSFSIPKNKTGTGGPYITTAKWKATIKRHSPTGTKTYRIVAAANNNEIIVQPSQSTPIKIPYTGTVESSITVVPPTPTPSPPNNGGGGMGTCPPECFDFDPDCPCNGGGGGTIGKSCKDFSPNNFIKAAFAPVNLPAPYCECVVTPILIDIEGNGFALTDANNGVPFDFNGDGLITGKLAWTAAESDDAWLVLDRNRDNRIDSGQELFGNAAPQPEPPSGEERQGFLALAEYDKPEKGGDGDGKITRRDSVFKKLRLWQDKNHNGISEAEELSRLPALDIVAVFLDYKKSRRTDGYGNEFKYRAKVRDTKGAKTGRWAWDVFLKSSR